MSINIKKSHFNSFTEFLDNPTMWQFGITLVVALQVKNITTNITDTVLTPIIENFLHSPLNKYYVNIYGVDFYFGKIISSVITFFMIMLMIYVFIKVTKMDEKLEAPEKKEGNTIMIKAPVQQSEQPIVKTIIVPADKPTI
jgi:large-conductance mechanosensitive channel